MISHSCSAITTKKQCNIFFKISTGEQHTATDLVNLLYFLQPVSPDHTDLNKMDKRNWRSNRAVSSEKHLQKIITANVQCLLLRLKD